MVDVRLLDRLHALQQRRRWLIGLRVGRGCRRVRAALVGIEGRGLAARAEVFAHAQAVLPSHVRQAFASLHRGKLRRGRSAALLAAQLAECQAVLLEELAGEVAPVWERVLAVAVDDPGLWSSAAGLHACQGLCDAARLAELSGQNVIDAFSARDLAQEGRGRPLSPLPHWLLLHDKQKNRLLVQWGRAVRITFLPASRDTSGAHRMQLFVVPAPENATAEPAVGLTATIQAVAERLAAELPPGTKLEELLLSGRPAVLQPVAEMLTQALAGVRILSLEHVGVPPTALAAAGTALVGLLHLDQTPANLPAITGAHTARVLGRLTPGSLPAWHRLVRELSAASPSVMPLRSAI